MRVCCISDIHGNLIKDIPECDLLLIAGDLCPVYNHQIDYQEGWLRYDFKYWLQKLPAKQIIFIAGNHDYVLQKRQWEMYKIFKENFPAHITYLFDESVEYEGLKIYGTPWQPYFYDWAFNLYEPELQEKFKNIPEGTNLLLCHGPPYGILDGAWDGRGKHAGSISLKERIMQVNPSHVIFGHIHESYGEVKQHGIHFINCSVLDREYEYTNPPIMLEI